VDALPPVYSDGCLAAVLLLYGGCFAIVFQASLVMVYPLCRFSLRSPLVWQCWVSPSPFLLLFLMFLCVGL
jgi:hypothetical protein